MTKFLKGSLLTAALIAGQSASAALIDFSSMPSQANYAGNADFTVTTYGGPETDINLNPHIYGGRLVNSSDPLNPSSAYPTEDIIDFDFNVGLDSISVDMFWAGNPYYGSTGVTLTSYDIDGNVLEQFGYRSGLHATYNFDSTDLIYSIQANTNLTHYSNWWYGINSIDYTPGEASAAVSEPATLALLAVGLVGIGATRKLKKDS